MNEPANFTVNITDTNSPFTEGDTLEVNATIENTGDENDSQNVTLDAGALGNDSANVSLSGGATTSEIFTLGTGPGDAGEYTATVSSENDSDSTSVTVNSESTSNPAFFDVNITGTNSPVTEGGTLEVTANVTNTGNLSDTQPITLNDTGFEDREHDNVSLTLNGGESNSSVTLSWDTNVGVNGTGNVTVSSENDSDTREVTIDEETSLAPVNDFDNPPQDLDGDGLHEDINGDGEFNLGDVIALYENSEDPVLNDNPELFNFNGQENPDEVTLGDVIALYDSV